MLRNTLSIQILALLFTTALALPQGTGTPLAPSNTSTLGAATSSEPTIVSDPTLPGHTIYRPFDMTNYNTLPVIVWGNGACSADSDTHRTFHRRLGKHRSTAPEMMTELIDWAQGNAGRGEYVKMNASKIAAAGMSCGGLEAYEQAQDERVSAIGTFNSGQFTEQGTQEVVSKVMKPIFFFLGGPSDIAYENGMRDFDAVPEGVPTWVGNVDTGHLGTYSEPKGGVYGAAA
ncbi:hypothetical protein M409DRAFT_17087 [Zasmidium cellare ATCC 36951]|uniref:Alpha/beta-hydrolase n=1 Tax=Zasmidium cellare ATCC 36951 TaxID=1080233 RepID=A0A6A6D450_ZASCE|nr:uncharacterized protein M409DRAFT_17087 [Zasmidium cellare ATCC 36951]KAF2173140.1 hypothetical protein M409DRAFT_17087 [Zasmidium cellare ATCC 36951]